MCELIALTQIECRAVNSGQPNHQAREIQPGQETDNEIRLRHATTTETGIRRRQ